MEFRTDDHEESQERIEESRPRESKEKIHREPGVVGFTRRVAEAS
jgi:hypothetical protein